MHTTFDISTFKYDYKTTNMFLPIYNNVPCLSICHIGIPIKNIEVCGGNVKKDNKV